MHGLQVVYDRAYPQDSIGLLNAAGELGLGLTMPMAEQNFTHAIRIAERGFVLVQDAIAFEAESAEALGANHLVRQFYLGA